MFGFERLPFKFSRFYKFTSKSQSIRGIMATVLGGIAMVSFVVVIMASFKGRGEGTLRMGATGFLSLIFALVGFILGARSLYEKEKFPWFRLAGVFLSLFALMCWGYILFLGTGVLTI